MKGPSIVFILVMLLVPIVIFWLNDYLACRRISSKSKLPRQGYWLISLVALGTLIYSRVIMLWHQEWSQLLYQAVYFSYAWIIGQVVWLVALLIALAVIWLISWFITDKSGPNLRQVFWRYGTAGLLIVALLVTAYGVYQSGKPVLIVNRTLVFNQLPVQLKGFTIAQISDTHLGPFFTVGKLDEVLQAVAEQRPDMLVITGDLIDDLRLLPETVEKISALAATIPHGVYFCWGNHEYFRDKDSIEQALANSPIKLLENSSELLFVGQPPIYLAGVDYPWGSNRDAVRQQRQADLAQALATVSPKAFTILLAHHPDYFEEAFAAGIPLTLSGHTHGGQVVVGGYPLLPTPYKYMLGLYESNGSYGYVSAGTGHWLPFRLGCPTEITLFTLE